MLVPSGAQRHVTVDVSKQMLADQQQRVSDTCFWFPASTSVGHSVSTDGHVSVSTAPGGFKKPHQQKHICANKTITVSRRRLNAVMSDTD